MIELGDILYCLLLMFSTVPFLIVVSNVRFMRSISDSINVANMEHNEISVSVLIPARNESDRIAHCLRNLSAQRYPTLEILILDDQSTDNTAEIVKTFVDSDDRIRLISGTEMPDGWLGKHWACQQLFEQATGEILLFVDADTILSPGTVEAAVYEMERRELDLLTAMPRRIAGCLAEKLILPIVDWSVLAWLPLRAAQKYKNPYLSATFGQFMIFRREAYIVIGGHGTIRDDPIDDFGLGRMIKQQGLKWMLFDGSRCIEVLPYKGNIDSLLGVSRSVFPAMKFRATIFVPVSAMLCVLGFLPLIVLADNLMFNREPNVAFLTSTASILVISVSMLIVCRKFRHNVMTVPLYPLLISVILAVGYHSVFSYVFNLAQWRGRRIIRRRIGL